MARALWKGTLSFGLVAIPVKVMSATEEKDISFRQVHNLDGGRIRYRRICEICGEEVPFADIAKGYEAPDGRQAILTAEDFAELPLSSAKTIEIVAAVELGEVDPALFNKAYLLSPEAAGAKPYVLLRDALAQVGRAALVKVALRSRESLALIRATGDVLMMHTMLWPDELRAPDAAAPDADVKASEGELAMAAMFIEQLAVPFEPTAYTDSYREALEAIVEQKLSGIPIAAPAEAPVASEKVVDLVAALRESVEAAKRRREEQAEAG